MNWMKMLLHFAADWSCGRPALKHGVSASVLPTTFRLPPVGTAQMEHR